MLSSSGLTLPCTLLASEQVLYASRLLPIVRKHHLLLVTLLLCNAGCMEALPLFLDNMMPDYLAIIVSVTAVLFFGEYVF